MSSCPAAAHSLDRSCLRGRWDVILISVLAPSRRLRADFNDAPTLFRHGARMRMLVLGLAASLALVLIVAAGHRHDSSLAMHECGVCAVQMDELPPSGSLPALVVVVLAQSYLVAVAVVHVCLYRGPRLMPPSCGPPRMFLAT
jgi:hypothetical protein